MNGFIVIICKYFLLGNVKASEANSRNSEAKKYVLWGKLKHLTDEVFNAGQ
jgi:hypothetical protein